MAEETLDGRWFHRLQAIHAGIPARITPNNLRTERERFLSGESENPDFSYSYIDDAGAEHKINHLISLRDDVSREEANLVVKDLYLEKIEEKINEIKLVKVSAKLQVGTKEEDLRDYVHLAELLYEKPDANVLASVTNFFRENVEEIPQGLPSIFYKDQASSYSYVAARKYFDVSADNEDDQAMSLEEVCSFFKSALQKRGLSDWRVVRKQNQMSVVTVMKRQKKIAVSSSLGKRFTRGFLEGLVAHEVDCHVLRLENGLSSPLQLLHLGLAKHGPGEEGIATVFEQQVTGSDRCAGAALFLASALALGVDEGGEKRNFREVYTIMVQYFKALYSELDSEKTAFRVCARVFQGVPAYCKGAAFLKETLYYKGNLRIRKIIEEDPTVRANFSMGRYDPANPKHVKSLELLEII